MKRRHTVAPRILTLKYPARCAETGRGLPAGSPAWWVYTTAKAYATDSTMAATLAAEAAAVGDRFDMLAEDRMREACGA